MNVEAPSKNPKADMTALCLQNFVMQSAIKCQRIVWASWERGGAQNFTKNGPSWPILNFLLFLSFTNYSILRTHLIHRILVVVLLLSRKLPTMSWDIVLLMYFTVSTTQNNNVER